MLKPVFRVPVLFFFLCFIFPFMIQPAQGASRLVWRIGDFDQSSKEFEGKASSVGSGIHESASVFRVGKDDWRRQWPAFHSMMPTTGPGVPTGSGSPSLTGQATSMTRTILFSLKRPPLGTFSLKISTLHSVSRPSYLRVAVNGRWGRFYFRPQLNDSSEVSTSSPHGSADAPKPNTLLPDALLPDTLSIDLPSGYFRLGENRLELSFLEEDAPSDSEAKPSAGEQVSGIYYDALQLSADAVRPFRAAAVRARVAPTNVFECRSGERVGLVAVVVRLYRKTRVGSVQLLVNGHWYRKDFPVDADFGERRVELEVPEWQGEVDARLRVEISGPAKVFPVRLRAKRK